MELNDFKGLAVKVVDSMRIRRKENPGIEAAFNDFGDAIGEIINSPSVAPDDLRHLVGNPENLIEELTRFEYGPLLYEKNGSYIVKKDIGETVKIVYSELNPICEKLAKYIRDECWKCGAHVYVSSIRDLDKRRMHELMPEDSLAELNPLEKAIVENVDVRIFIGYGDDMSWSAGLESKLRISAPVNSKIKEISEERKTRWCFLGWPVEMEKQDYFVDIKKYEEVFINALYESFSEETLKNCTYFHDKLIGKDNIKIVADDGTDLTFSIKNRRILIDDAIIDDDDLKYDNIGLNIPSGEVFMAPNESSANGKIIFDYVSIRGFGLVKNLLIKFQDGKVIDYDAEEGREAFAKYLESNVGDIDIIAELGIGCNPKADFIGATLVDEKIFGTIHIAIGANTGSFGGTNIASGHQDMIKFMTGKKSELWADDVLVMKDGMIVE